MRYLWLFQLLREVEIVPLKVLETLGSEVPGSFLNFPAKSFRGKLSRKTFKWKLPRRTFKWKPGGLRCPSPRPMPRPSFLHSVEFANLKLRERKCFFRLRGILIWHVTLSVWLPRSEKLNIFVNRQIRGFLLLTRAVLITWLSVTKWVAVTKRRRGPE